ncbi:MAG: hypothetical protein KBS96_06700 [Lachnospiraceae bacterium]|nr:hypothetical protein [Candidatus Colinaster scatohippi]
MNKRFKKIAGIALGLIITTANILGNATFALAANDVIATVQGTVVKGTTSDLLCLYNTSEGTYQIKIDSDTNLSGCKVLSVGKAVKVAISRGDDNYLHAVTIEGTGQNKLVSVDTENSVTVSGTVLDSTTEEMMILKTTQGDMCVKIDPTTDMSGCRVVVAGMKINVTVARGSDAVMHAVRISDSYATDTNGSYGYTDNTVATTGTVTDTTPVSVEGTVAVSGNPADGTTEQMLCLNTDSGIMKVAIDSKTDTSGGFVFTAGNKLTVYVYRGDDAVMHAAKVVGKRAELTENSAASTTFTGTVSSSSTEDTLVVLTSGGTMKFKVDANTALNGGKAVLKGKAITISATTGSDKYWHATSITVR